MSPDARRFSFLELDARTPNLDAPTRAAVFDALPLVLQEQAWAHLRERMDHVSDCDLRDWCGARV